jgi:hypothetical protein
MNISTDFVLLESAKANRKELKSVFGQVFHFKLVSFSVMKKVLGANIHPCLKLYVVSAHVLSCHLKFVQGILKGEVSLYH